MMPEDRSQGTKMFGYMEKRGKMTIRGRWKQRWCVLEGHLLLYYKSQAEYLKLSPCCGSLNMTLVRKIHPDIGRLIHITTHSKTIILRTPDKEKQEQWFNALATVLKQSYPDDLHIESLFPSRSLPRKPKKNNDRRSVTISEMNEQNLSDHENFNSEENNNSIKLPSTNNETDISWQPILKRNPHNTIISRCSSDSNIHATPTKKNFKESQRSFSCGCISTQLPRNQNIATRSICDDSGDRKAKRTSKVHWNDAENDTISFVENSEPIIVRRNSKKRNKNKVIHRHSFSFLKKLLTKRKGRRLRKEAQKQRLKALQDLNNCFFTSIVAVTTALHLESDSEEMTDFQEPSHESSNLVNLDSTEEIAVSVTNTNESIKVEDSQSWTKIEYDGTAPEVLPELPVKTKKNCVRYSWQKQESTNVNSEMVDSSTTSNPNTELDLLMSQLTDLNRETGFLHNLTPPSDDKIPDYDIPRSHLSIISERFSEPTDTENSSIGSPDDRYLSLFGMDPDSLEMPWLSNDELNHHQYWPARSGGHFILRDDIESDEEDDDISYLDSLNIKMNRR